MAKHLRAARFLDGFASAAKLGADGEQAFARARAEAGLIVRCPAFPDAANVLIFAEFGLGPRKYAAGQYGERLKFLVRDSPAHAARLIVLGRTVGLPAYDDLNLQAVTRGGRVMDYILGNKAVSNAPLTRSAMSPWRARPSRPRTSTMTTAKRASARRTAFALASIGLISKIASSATTRADTPRRPGPSSAKARFAAIPLPAGDYPATLEFLDASGRPLAGEDRPLTIHVGDPARDTVVFLSELKG